MAARRIVRVGETFTGTCYNHKIPRAVTGHVVSGCWATANGKAISRNGDLVCADGDGGCGHYGMIHADNALFDIEGIPVALTGDSIVRSAGAAAGARVTLTGALADASLSIEGTLDTDSGMENGTVDA